MTKMTIVHKLTILGILAIIPFLVDAKIYADADGELDDKRQIINNLKKAMPAGGMISIEQKTGRLIFNPSVSKLSNLGYKKNFLLPAMMVNQESGMQLVAEMPFSCFIISAEELRRDDYKGYRQHDTLRYIQDVKSIVVRDVMICNLSVMSADTWKETLKMDPNSDNFVFSEHTSMSGDRFYYFLNSAGSFEMYM